MKLINLSIMIVVAAGISLAGAQNASKTTSKKNAEPAAEKARISADKILGGPVISVNQEKKLVVIRRNGNDYAVDVSSAILTQGGKSITIADIKKDDGITVSYVKKPDGTRAAKTLSKGAAMAPAAKSAGKAPQGKAPAAAAPAKKSAEKQPVVKAPAKNPVIKNAEAKKAEVKSQPKTDPKAEIKTDTKKDTAASVKAPAAVQEKKAEVKAAVKPEIKTDTKKDTAAVQEKAEIKTEQPKAPAKK